jgi:DNA polymerase-3 subunit delta
MRRDTSFPAFVSALRRCCEEIDAGRPSTCYLIHGGEEYLAGWAATNLLDRLLPGTARGEGLMEFDFRHRSPGAKGFMDMPGTLFADESLRVMLLKNPPVAGAEAKEFAGRFLAQAAPKTVAVVTSSREIAASSPLFQHISDQKGTILKVPAIDSQQEATAFLEFLATRNLRSQVKADASVLQEVLLRVGLEEPRQLVREMEKLSLYVGNDRPATPDDVRQIITASPSDNAFSLLAQITGGRANDALAALTSLLAQRTPHVLLVGAIGHELRRLLQARAILDSGEVSPALVSGGFDDFRRGFDDEKRQAMAQRLPAERRNNLFLQHPYAIFRCLQQALPLSRETLARCLEAVVEADFQLKTSSQPEGQILEALTLELCDRLAPSASSVR